MYVLFSAVCVRKGVKHLNFLYIILNTKLLQCFFLLLIKYCCDMFRPQFLGIFIELISLCSLYVNLFGRNFYIYD